MCCRFVTPAHSWDAIILNIDFIIWFVWSFISSLFYAEFWQTKQTNRHWDLCFVHCIPQAHRRCVLVCMDLLLWPSMICTPVKRNQLPRNQFRYYSLYSSSGIYTIMPYSSTMHRMRTMFSLQCSADLLFCISVLVVYFTVPYYSLFGIFVKMRNKIQTTWFTMLCNALKQETNWKKIGFCSIPY